MVALLESEVDVVDRPAYRPYAVAVSRVQQLTDHFVRVTFTGDDLHHFGTAGLDQRVKLLFPIPGIGISDVGHRDPQTINDGSWYDRWRHLPDDVRNPIRTYTIRHTRQEMNELDVDFAAHGDGGPAARWLLSAGIGDELVIVGPDSRAAGSDLGLHWNPGDASIVLLAGDETAAPAICAILEALPHTVDAHAFIEVPTGADALELAVHDSCAVTWIARDDSAHGHRLDSAVRGWVTEHTEVIAAVTAAAPQPLATVDVDVELIWDAPEDVTGNSFFAWIAGESAVIKTLRRHLVSDTGIDRSRVAFMGYWRQGKSEGS